MRIIAAVILVFLLSSCAEISRKTVELNDTVGRDLGTLHEVNLALVDTLFDRMEGDVERFIDEDYRPAYVKMLVEEFNLLEEINRAMAEQPEAVLWVLEDFVAAAVEDVDQKRMELLTKIRSQRNRVRSEIDKGFNQVRAGHATVSAHLASVVKVHDAQSEILAKVGLGNLRHEVAMRTANVSRKIEEITGKAKKVEGKWDEKVAAMDELINKIKEQLN